MLVNPSEEEFLKDLEESEKNTWKHIKEIKFHCMLEYVLDDCVKALRHDIQGLTSAHATSTHTNEMSKLGRTHSFIAPGEAHLGSVLPRSASAFWKEGSQAGLENLSSKLMSRTATYGDKLSEMAEEEKK